MGDGIISFSVPGSGQVWSCSLSLTREERRMAEEKWAAGAGSVGVREGSKMLQTGEDG